MQTPNGKGPLAPDPPAAPVDLRTASVFCREGEYWTIAYEGTVFRLRDSKGLHCLVPLLRQPGQAIPAGDLLGTASKPEPPTPGLSISPTSPADREHARVLVTKHIKAAIEKITTHHASLGHHLRTCVQTGSSCTYLPDPQRAPRWRL